MKRWLALFAVAAPLAAQSGFTGPYPVVLDAVPTLPDHTIYRPADLSKVPGKLPVIANGNGGCINQGNYQEGFLAEVASYGFIVTAPGAILRGGVKQDVPPGGIPAQNLPPGGGRAPQAAPPATTPQAPAAPAGQGRGAQGAANLMAGRQSKPDQMIAVLDWVMTENAREGSIFRGKLDADHLAVMGGSCGGLEAIFAAGDPRVKTFVGMNTGIIRGQRPAGAQGPGMSMPASEADLAKIHTPSLYVIGGPKDVAYPNAEKDFEAIQKVPLFNANIEAGHSGTWMESRGGAMGEVVIAWMRWQLQSDKTSARMFQGPDCGLCTDKRWTVKKKNME